MPARERKRVPDDRSDILKGSLPKSPPAHPWDTENPSTWGWTKRRRRRMEVKQLREVWRSCNRDNVVLCCPREYTIIIESDSKIHYKHIVSVICFNWLQLMSRHRWTFAITYLEGFARNQPLFRSLPMLWVPTGSLSRGGACWGWCFWHKPTEIAHSFLFCSYVCFCLYGSFNCISFHEFSRELSAFLLCSPWLLSDLLVLSTIYL